MIGEAAELVGAGEDSQGAVLRGGVVEVEAEGDHLHENGDGGLDVRNAVLDRPRSEAGDVPPLLDGEGEVLMPGDLPVGVRCLVEDRQLGRPCAGA